MGRTQFILRPRQIKNQEEWELNKKIYHRGVAWYMYLPIFVMNRVPSDIYRLKNPKLQFSKSKTVNGYVFINEKPDFIQINQIEGQSPILNDNYQDGAVNHESKNKN